MKKKGEDVLKCPKCNGALVFPDGELGESVCAGCGLVTTQDFLNQGYVEWTPSLYSQWRENESNTMREWLTVLRLISSQLNLPNMPYREEAARIIRNKRDIFLRSQKYGRNKKEVISALIYIILREYDKLRSLKDICGHLSLNYNLVSKMVWDIRKKTKFKTKITAIDYLWVYGGKIIKDFKLLKTTEKLLKNIRIRIHGNPVSLAAGALYLVCKKNNLKISKEKIGETFQISERTVYSNYFRIKDLI